MQRKARNPVLFSKLKRRKMRKIMRILIFRNLEFQFVFVHRLRIRGQILAPRLLYYPQQVR